MYSVTAHSDFGSVGDRSDANFYFDPPFTSAEGRFLTTTAGEWQLLQL
jgi:hypothetical protein